MANGITAKATGVATDITAKATGQWDKLENIFEERVAKALHRLGVPSTKDMLEIQARLDELQASVRALSAKPISKGRAASPKTGPAARRGTAPAKTPAKRVRRKSA